MSLSPLPTQSAPQQTNEIRPASTPIERFLLPLTVSLMEIQPLGLLVTLLTFLFTGHLNTTSLSPAFLFLLTLFLLAWAMLVEHFSHTSRIQQSAMHRSFITTSYILSWLIALAATANLWLSPLLIGTISPLLIISVALVTWLWRRTIFYARGGFDYSSLATAFKVGFGVLLFILLIALITPLGSSFLPALVLVAPLFFLSGLLSLSLARLVAVRRAHRVNDAQSDPVRPWLIALAALTAIVVALVVFVDAVFSFSSFESVLTFLSPAWNALNTAIDWLLYFLILIIVYPLYLLIQFLIRLSGGNALSNSQPLISPTRPPRIQTITHTTDLPTSVVAVSHWLLLALFFVVIVLILWRGIARLRSVYANDLVDETRESLDARTLLQQRFRDWWRNRQRQAASSPLEVLDPMSARAQYRRFLQHMAALDDPDLASRGFARRSSETPDEYELRLRAYLESQPIPPDQKSQAIHLLSELTHAYDEERYGAQDTIAPQRTSLPTWVDSLLSQWTTSSSTSPSRRGRKT